MMFFEIITVLKETWAELNVNERQEHAASLQPIIDGFFMKTERRCHISVSNTILGKGKVTLCAAIKKGSLASEIVEDFLAAID